jgi:hypothetical protein
MAADLAVDGARHIHFLGRFLAAAGAFLTAIFPAAAETVWSLRLPKDTKPSYRGASVLDGAGAKGASVLYPAPSLAGLVAAVLTHSALVESQKTREKLALQEEADKVLLPYQPILSQYTVQELMTRALERTPWKGEARLIAAEETSREGLLVDSAPIFSITQDQRGLILDNAIAIYRAGETTRPIYQSVVRVVSQPQPAQDQTAFWTRDEGAALKEESASLLAHSLTLALRASETPDATEGRPFKTIRYPEGGAQKVERAQLIARPCHRWVVKTLRGSLLSVPAGPGPEDEPGSCEVTLPGWK